MIVERSALKSYSLKKDRRFTEIALANALVNNQSYINDIDVTKVKLPETKKVIDFIEAATKKGENISPSYVRSRMRSIISAGDQKSSASSIDEICLKKHTDDEEFKNLKNHLYQLSTRERVITVTQSIIDRAYNGEDLFKVCSAAEAVYNCRSNYNTSFEVVSLGNAVDATIAEMTKQRREGTCAGHEFHIPGLNATTGGMFPKDLIIVAARPSVGKTAFALNVMFNSPEVSFGMVTSEMSNEQLTKRMISTESGIDASKLRKPELMTDKEFDDICIAAAKMKDRKIYLEDKGKINIAEIRDRVEEWVKYYGVSVVIIDYIQRIESDKTHGNKAEEIGYIAKRLKEMAKDFGICVIALAQINRDATKENRPPTMADIKASGDIEQEADHIIILYKPSMGSDAANRPCIVEAIVEKNRHGPIGLVLMVFTGAIQDFKEASDDIKLSYAA